MRDLSNEEIKFILKSLLDAINHTIFFENDEVRGKIKQENLKTCREIIERLEDGRE